MRTVSRGPNAVRLGTEATPYHGKTLSQAIMYLHSFALRVPYEVYRRQIDLAFGSLRQGNR